MTTEKVIEYETVEQEEEVAVCDFGACEWRGDESETLHLKNTDAGRNTHYCPDHASDVLNLDADVETIYERTELVVEESPIITMPWDILPDKLSVDDGSASYGAIYSTLWPIGFPCTLLNASDGYDIGTTYASIGAIFWIGLAFAIMVYLGWLQLSLPIPLLS